VLKKKIFLYDICFDIRVHFANALKDFQSLEVLTNFRNPSLIPLNSI